MIRLAIGGLLLLATVACSSEPAKPSVLYVTETEPGEVTEHRSGQ